MPELERHDGTRIFWEDAGEGPAVVIVPWLNGNPEVLSAFTAELTSDHRVVRFDARGTGRSSREGPHDVETLTADLEAVAEEIGGAAVLVAMADAVHHAVRAAARSPEIATTVFVPGGAPFGRDKLRDFDAMAGSDTVVDAFVEMLESYYESALRAIITDANPQMSEAEIRERIDQQVAYCPQDVAVERMREWIEADSLDAAVTLGGRLIILSLPEPPRPWFPSKEELDRVIREWLPAARLEPAADGLLSRPDLGAAIVRGVTQELGVGAAEQ